LENFDCKCQMFEQYTCYIGITMLEIFQPKSIFCKVLETYNLYFMDMYRKKPVIR